MTQREMLDFDEWTKLADEARTGDPLWSVQAYRLSVYAIECHTLDRRANTLLGKAAAVDQLTRAVGSVAANIAEGYSRASVKDRVRFYGYALGSARESIAWYDDLRVELGEIVTVRQATPIQIRRLLLTMLRKTRTTESLLTFRDSANGSQKPDPR